MTHGSRKSGPARRSILGDQRPLERATVLEKVEWITPGTKLTVITRGARGETLVAPTPWQKLWIANDRLAFEGSPEYHSLVMTAEEALREALRKPGDDQTRDDVRAWMKAHARPGLVVVIRNTMVGVHSLTLDVIEEIVPRTGRIYTSKPEAFKAFDRGVYYFTGQSATDPRGQVSMLIPRPELVAIAIADTKAFTPMTGSATIFNFVAQTEGLFGVDLTRYTGPATD